MSGPQSDPPTTTKAFSEGAFGCATVNVDSQRRDPESLLNWTERIVRLRKECPEFGWGTYRVLPVDVRGVVALHYEWRGNALVTVHNFRDRPATVALRVPGHDADRLHNLLCEDHSHAPRGHHRIEIEPYGYRWYRVGGADAVTRRTAE